MSKLFLLISLCSFCALGSDYTLVSKVMDNTNLMSEIGESQAAMIDFIAGDRSNHNMLRLLEVIKLETQSELELKQIALDLLL